jgi:signal transduction histidine kinase
MVALRFGRRFFAPDAMLALIELAVVVGPPLVFFGLTPVQRHTALAATPVALGLASLAWFLVVRAWRAPIGRATRRRLTGEVLDAAARADAYRAILTFPRRAAALRVVLWTAVAASVAAAMVWRADFPVADAASIVVVAAAHSLGVTVFRALWYRRILGAVREALLPDLDTLQRFADSWRESLVLGAVVTGTLGVLAVAAFTWFFIPLNLEQYVRLETWFPATIAALALAWLVWERRLLGPVTRYLTAALSPKEQPARDDPRAVEAYRSAQWIPYALAIAKVGFWLVAELALMVQGVLLFGIDSENAALMVSEAFVVTLGVAIYEALWHRSTMRPLLRHLAARHRPPPERVRTPLSLRNKMLVGFGALSLFAIGLQQLWSFMQYKTTVTQYISRESELRLEATLLELKERHAVTTDEILAVLRANVGKRVGPAPRGIPEGDSIFYYLPPSPSSDSHPIAVGRAAPPLPWTGEALMRRLDRGRMELSALHLTGSYVRVYADKQDLGAIALLLPGYRGRGPSTAPQIQLLVGLTVLLLLLAAGFVVLLAIDLTRPIRELERRAMSMARGDLTQPVVSATGEADEVGRLAYALEELRQELNRKFRSSTEINLSLEQEVARRTAELERRNKELAEALEQLKRAQDELIRSEKMASMGRLVAGIAHEINNPVNAVVNTVGPLADALSHAKDVDDVHEMLKVIQRGAKRTKEIVQALHNYSRGDDDRIVEVDVHRGLDESLDLLRHHLKNGIQVERQYGDVGRVRARNAINQVFMNLLTNAAQALEKQSGKQSGGKITIATERNNGKVIVKIADDGPGIPPEILPRIFDPFFTTKDVGEGSGLGLSIVHGIVERHGGSISVDSEVGRGTTFTVTLPQA